MKKIKNNIVKAERELTVRLGVRNNLVRMSQAEKEKDQQVSNEIPTDDMIANT